MTVVDLSRCFLHHSRLNCAPFAALTAARFVAMRVGLGNQWEGPIILTLSEIQYTDTTSRSAKRQRNMLDVEGTPRL